MSLQYAKTNADSTHPVKFTRPVTQSDTTVLEPFRGLWVGTGGDVTIGYLDGTSDTWRNVASGVLLPVQGNKVLASTTADDILAGY